MSLYKMRISKLNKSIIGVLVSIAMLFGILINPNQPKSKAADVSKYGILIADANGKYTFYDWNTVKGTQRIINKSSSVIMVPLRKLCNSLGNISYTYDFNSNKATITNTTTGKRMVLTKNSKVAYTYANAKSKGVKVTMKYKMYLDSSSNAAMVEASTLSYIMNNKKGYQIYNKSKQLDTAGYAISQYKGILVYNSYKKVNSLPSALKVSYSSEKIESNIKKVTIPEGYSVAQIFDLLVSKGVCASRDALFDACNNADFSQYKCIANQDQKEYRCFKLEGYLYPDTYQFYGNSEPVEVLKKMVANTDSKITEADYVRAAELGYTMDQILTLASMIEKETGLASERTNVSSVLHNRLQIKMKLQCDCTIYYVERYVKPYLKTDVNRYNSYYNTRKCSGLPEGPIANPGRKVIDAALYPKDTEYLYFCSDKEGAYHYFVTYEEQKAFLNSLETETSTPSSDTQVVN